MPTKTSAQAGQHRQHQTTPDISTVPILGNGTSAGTIPSNDSQNHEELKSPFMVTDEAAKYLRKSTSWLLRQPDLPYLKGTPNLYTKSDLDAWFQRHKFKPSVRVAQ